MKKFILIACGILVFSKAKAVGDDTAVWKNFQFIASKSTLNTGSLRINIPNQSSGSMADLLNQYSALFVKYYSPGSLASTSMRGMGAQHTAIMWNGINIQSSMNSNMDLNLLPAFFIDQAAIETGANASSCGNGAIGGAILLNNTLTNGKKVYADLSTGSFGQRDLGIGAAFAYKKLKSNTRMLYRYAENNFDYVNIFKIEKPSEKMPNNRFSQQGFMQEFGLDLNPKHTLYANVWYLQSERQLPPVIGASNLAKERQNDFNSMVLLKHTYKKSKKIEVNTKFAVIEEKINYYNNFYKPALNTARSFLAESEIKGHSKYGLDWTIAVKQNYQKAWTDGYRKGVDRQLWSLFTQVNWQNKSKKLKLSGGNRILYSDGERAPLTPDFGFEYVVNKYLQIKGNSAYSFRLPSFNDLYWQPGGNVLLKPEKGKKAELSLEHKNKYFKIGGTVFMHQVDDWIMWLPDTASVIWKAFNAKQVQSQGVELNLETTFTLGKHHFLRLNSRYQYVKSINSEVYGRDNNNLGKQLFYTPYHTSFASLRYIYKSYAILFGSSFNGARYTTADNSKDHLLESYLLHHITVSKNFTYKKFNSSLEFSISNLGNVSYSVFENRPMPLRNYQIKYKFNINYE